VLQNKAFGRAASLTLEVNTFRSIRTAGAIGATTTASSATPVTSSNVWKTMCFPRNPVADTRPGDILMPRKKRHYPRVTARELPDLLRAIHSNVGGEHTRLGVELMTLTFVRTSELIGARWSEFDLLGSRWDVPAERMKMKTPHVVPLSRQAKLILNELKANSFGREFILPSDVDRNRPMSNISSLRFIEGISRKNDWARISRREDRAPQSSGRRETSLADLRSDHAIRSCARLCETHPISALR
jgi:integrase